MNQTILRFRTSRNAFELNLTARTLVREPAQDVALQTLHFDLLALFVQRPRTVLLRDELLREVWAQGEQYFASDDVINNAIAALRRAIEDDDHTAIVTVPKKGYRFDASILDGSVTGPGTETRPTSGDPEAGRNPDQPIRLEQLLATSEPYPGEVFASLLLTAPVAIERSGDGNSFVIDRRQANEVVLNNRAKAAACKDHVLGRREELIALDRQLQEFLVGPAGSMAFNPTEHGLRLRWASGGVLSVVTYKNRDWVPFFFRDIPPFGWNISLGNSERRFDNHPTPWRVDSEWNHPLLVIDREFLEETIVLDGDPATAAQLKYWKFYDSHLHSDPADAFVKTHTHRRAIEDGLTIGPGAYLPFSVDPVGGSLKVQTATQLHQPIRDVLVCFSLLDLGIEVVRVHKYELGPAAYFLDGEVLSPHSDTELIRMPVALMSCSFLCRVFGKNMNWFQYRRGVAPSIEIQEQPRASDVHLYPWDIQKRMAVVDGVAGAGTSEWRYRRCVNWYDAFGSNFVDLDGQPTSENLSRLFVPATAKILHQYFTLPRVFERYSVMKQR